MSDYGDDYSDYGDDFYYVEDEYMAADDLAEHAVASPPPTYADDDALSDWDRFDYFNDLEYASDGYDDATFQSHNAADVKIGQKRKRVTDRSHDKKRRKTTEDAENETLLVRVTHSPIVWRAQSDRELKPRLLGDNAQSYALLKNWREKLAETPHWARGSPHGKSKKVLGGVNGEANAANASELPPTTSELLDETDLAEDEQIDEDEGGMDISQEALMAALQKQLAAAGGPLSGMDPQQLLDFAMRMATGKDAGDDIAGEMAEAMLEGEDEEDDGTAEENLMSWVAQQRNANKDSASELKSPDVARSSNRLPTPPLSEASRSIQATDEKSEAKSKSWTAKETRTTSTRKRKADEEVEAESSTKATKKRATRSFDAPTAASQARTTRATKAKR
jgi:hypothetical protein